MLNIGYISALISILTSYFDVALLFVIKLSSTDPRHVYFIINPKRVDYQCLSLWQTNSTSTRYIDNAKNNANDNFMNNNDNMDNPNNDNNAYIYNNDKNENDNNNAVMIIVIII